MLLNALLYPHLLFVKSLAARSALIVYPVAPATQHVNEMGDTEVNGSGKGKLQPVMDAILNGEHDANEETNEIVNFLEYTNSHIYYHHTNVLIKLA